MTAVRHLLNRASYPARVAGIWLCLCLVCLTASSLLAAPRPAVHWQYSSGLPPGAIGGLRLGRGGPVSGYFQAVEIRVPGGAQVAAAVDGRFDQAHEQLRVGMLIAPVYRLRVTHIVHHEGRELYPTVEVIDRLYPPPHESRRFAIPIHITQEELELALDGRFITRVIYLEDPNEALPIATDGATELFDVPAGYDPLEIADVRGRPVAILRIGSRVPAGPEPSPSFLYHSPPVQRQGKALK